MVTKVTTPGKGLHRREIVDLDPVPVLLVSFEEVDVKRVVLIDYIAGLVIEDGCDGDVISRIDHLTGSFSRAAGKEMADGRNFGEEFGRIGDHLLPVGKGYARLHPEKDAMNEHANRS